MDEIGEPSDSFTAAWAKARFPSENESFVRRFTAEVGIVRFRYVDAAERHIAATRRDGLRELHIYSGYTNGLDEEEARRLGAGSDTVRESSKSNRGWFISHPVHGNLDLRDGTARNKQREAALCPNGCGYELSVSGTCPECDAD